MRSPALYLSIEPSAFLFALEVHLLPIVRFPGIGLASSHVQFFVNDLIFSLAASNHLFLILVSLMFCISSQVFSLVSDRRLRLF